MTHSLYQKIQEEVKTELQNLISKNGGENVEFRPKIVTHLLVGEAQGPKYDWAKKELTIRIMKQEWIYESVKNGYPMLEYDYLFEPSNTQPQKFDFLRYNEILNNSPSNNSQPSQHSQSIEQARVQSLQISSMIASPNLQISSQIDSEINTPMINGSQIVTPQMDSSQESTQKDNLKPQVPEPGKTYCVKSKAELAKSDSSDNTTKRTAFSVLTSSQNANKIKTAVNVEEELEQLANQLINCKSSIFDGCEFYIYDNFQQNIKVLLKRCITLQHGTISTSLRQSVTHVIVKEESAEPERKKLKSELVEFDHTINQVTLKWIIQCLKSNKLVPLINNQIESPTNKEQRSFSQQSVQRSISQAQKRLPRFPRHNSSHNPPTSQKLPIREIQPSRTENLFDDYSDASNIQSNVVDSSQTQTRNVFDLDLMRREEKPLYGCVLTFSSYTVALKDELTGIAKRLGASCQSDFVKNNKPDVNKQKNTHLVCEYARGDKYEKAKKWGVFVVNQHWLRNCQHKVQRLNESKYLPKEVDNTDKRLLGQMTNLNIQRTNSNPSDCPQSSGSIISSSSSSAANGENDQKYSLSQTVNVPIIQGNQNFRDIRVPGSNQTVESKLENLKTILNTNEPTIAFNKTLAPESNLGTIKNMKDMKIDILNDDRSCLQNKAMMPSIPIAWDDHRTKEHSIDNTSFGLQANLKNATTMMPPDQTTINQTTISTSIIHRDKLIEKQNEPFQVFEDNSTIDESTKSQRKFCFIGYNAEERRIFAKELSKLNITLSTDGLLDHDYVITQDNKLIKNECFFISIAQGKWILHPDFYHKTIELGRIPNPEEYEWGSAERYMKRLDRKYQQLAKACRYWRMKVAQTKTPAFSGHNAMVVSRAAKNYANIILNGGGRALIAELQSDSAESYALTLSELYKQLSQNSITNLDYILINYKKKERDNLRLLELIKPFEALNIRCLQIDYLSLFLVSNEKLDYKGILVNPDVAPHINLKRSLNTSDDSSVISRKMPRK